MVKPKVERYPPLSVQFKQGTVSFYTGKEHYPPYKKDTVQFKEWQRGYNHAYYDNLKRVHAREQSL
jgi:hypothetical protein